VAADSSQEKQAERKTTRMANVFLIGVEQTMAAQISRAVSAERHRVQQEPHDDGARGLKDVGIIFAGGDPAQYLSLLKRVRRERPALPFVVVTGSVETAAWLDALEAGATDYCCAPFEARQIQWLMECALPMRRAAAATFGQR
jgi:two-component system, response regulator FlrC